MKKTNFPMKKNHKINAIMVLYYTKKILKPKTSKSFVLKECFMIINYVSEEINKIKKEKADEISKLCTYKPKINKTSQELTPVYFLS